MLHSKNTMPLFIKIPLLFITILLSSPLYARHKCLSTHDVIVNGVLQENNSKFFGSCVRCEEVLCDLVNTIAKNESRFCTETDCFFPAKSLTNYNLIIEDQFNWNKDKNLIIHTRGDIVFENGGKIVSEKSGSIILRAGMEPGKKKEYTSTIKFAGDATRIEMPGGGKVKIYYNPAKEEKQHKYHNPRHYSYKQRIKSNNLNAYMLINDVNDLQNVRAFLSGDYALSQDIDATETKQWNDGKGFTPLKDNEKHMPFSGNFDGNNYSIKGLFINHPNEKEVGLFGRNQGFQILPNTIENLTLEDFDIQGDHYVGGLAGAAVNSNLLNIKIINPTIKSRDVAGGLIGASYQVAANSIQIVGAKINITAKENKGLVIGSANKSKITLLFETENEIREIFKKYAFTGNQDEQTTVQMVFSSSYSEKDEL